MITQEYFDELVLENGVLFGGTEKEAVEETIAQLLSSTSTSPDDISSQNQTTTTKESCLGHLSWTHPHTDTGIRIRQEIEEFRRALQRIVSGNEDNSSDKHDEISDCLRTIQSRCQENTLFMNLFVVEQGIEMLVDRWIRINAIVDSSDPSKKNSEIQLDEYDSIAKILVLVVSTKRSFQDRFQKEVATVQIFPQTWIEVFSLSHQQQQQREEDSGTLSLLQLAFHSMVRCEGNKRIWMNQTTHPRQFTRILLETLQTILSNNRLSNQKEQDDDDDKDESMLGRWICRIFTTLCTFDDFRQESNATNPTDGIVMQSGPEHGNILAEQGALPILRNYLEIFPRSDAAVASIRAMAIQDEIVQSILSMGILDTVITLLENTISTYQSSSRSSSIEWMTAAMGLFRNMAANDRVKTLFFSKYKIPNTLLHVMQTYGNVSLIQEHAAGFVAAVCLRHPDHAISLIEIGIHVEIVAAMERFPKHATLQRQAALAIRNLISRCPENRTKVLNDADTERVLREIASQHMTCQDEVYAALRDLGLSASCVHVIIADDDGTEQVKIQRQRPTFGERNPNFRPVFKES
jgi:hypothetical protein